MLDKIQLQRLDNVKKDIALLGFHFPVATIAKRTGYDKSNISNMLRGKVPCSINFINHFYAAFGEELDKARPNKEFNERPEAYSFDTTRLEKLKVIAGTLVELAEVINKML